MELRLLPSALVSGRRILVGTLFLGLLLAGLHAAFARPGWSSSAQLLVDVGPVTSIDGQAQAQQVAQQLALDYAQLAGTPLVLRQAAARAGAPFTAEGLGASVRTEAVPDTAFITVTATAGSPATATRAVDAVAQQLTVAARSLAGNDTAFRRRLRLVEVQPALAASRPAGPGFATELLIGAVLGIVAGAALVRLRERLDPRFRDLEAISATTDAEVVGLIPDDRLAPGTAAVSLPDRSPARYEAFRSLRTALDGGELLHAEGSVLAVTSAVPDEGKSSVVAGLAVALAAAGREVVVVEGDLRRARVAGHFGLRAGPGLTDVLVGAVPAGSALQRVEYADRIRVLRAGPAVLSSSELFESDGFAALLRELTGGSAVVLVDSPPLLALADAVAIARAADHTLLVVGAPIATAAEVDRAAAMLARAQIVLAGVVVNRAASIWSESPRTRA